MNIKHLMHHYKFLLKKRLKRINHRQKIVLSAGVAGCILLSTAFIMTSGAEVYRLTIAGTNAGYITDKSMVAEAMEEIKADDTGKENGLDITIDQKSISIQRTDLKANEITPLSVDDLEKKLISSSVCKAKGWAINVDGTNIVAVKSKEDATLVLNDVKNHYLTTGSEVISADFKETVATTQAAVKIADIMNPDDAASFILTGQEAPKVYTVQDGDTIWDIAAVNDMSPAELQNANPGFDPNKLKIGQQLNLFTFKPYVTVQTKELLAWNEKIDFNTVYEDTNTMNKGEIKVKTAGVYGSKDVKAEVTKENGVVLASTVLESTVIAEPQDQIALKGTKASSYIASRGGGRELSVNASGSDIVSYAKGFIGVPYQYGGTSPNGFDCSGFTRYVYAHFGASLPHNSASQYGYGTAIDKSNISSGDLVFFSSGSRGIGHVGIYVGGGKFIHSPQAGQSVEISSFSSTSLRYRGAVRIAE